MDNPEKAAIAQRLDDIETQVWQSLARYRFMEACAFMELWALHHKESGLGRQNPFQEVAALARRKYGEKLREVR